MASLAGIKCVAKLPFAVLLRVVMVYSFDSKKQGAFN
jgi:hypothetical protein